MIKRAKRPSALSPAARARYLIIKTILGLAPQALCFRPLRGLDAESMPRHALPPGSFRPFAGLRRFRRRRRASRRSRGRRRRVGDRQDAWRFR
jgi:hypothetical protein